MEFVKDVVKKAMPSLGSDQMDALMARLEELGVLSVDDLALVDAVEIKDTLPLIQCKRFVRAIQGLQEDSQAAPQFTSPGRSTPGHSTPGRSTPGRSTPGRSTPGRSTPGPSSPGPSSPGPSSPGCSSTPQRKHFHLPPTSLETADSPTHETYSVPWHKISSKVMDYLHKKKHIMGKHRREIVRIIADDYLHKHPGRPGRQKLREIASMIVGQYPASFKLTEPFGNKPFAKDGSETLFRQLEHRVENMARPQGSQKTRAADEGPTKRKSRSSARYGCVEWDPVIEETVSREDLLSKQEELKRAFETSDLQESSVRKLMSETYPLQRETINNETDVRVMKDEWPFLFDVPYLFDHASKLLGFSVQDKLAQELSKKEKGITDFLDSKGMKTGEGPIQLVCGIAKYFKEDPEQLFTKKEISTDPEVDGVPLTPCILDRDNQRFKIAVDREVVNDHITSPVVALSYVFSMFYVYNVRYPEKMALTLEFMQRIFFGINPERGSKAEVTGKKQTGIPPKVSRLVTQLKEFECKQKESEWAI
ncbi:uncharacterized protein LOC110946856 isoform X2 [Acanthochromis polyacanthus]|uniref:uncharacterized protein LOC110946856 isoform X2 n=1 Tax=Acanthochromis polyacanthus TaxID=80966 RepID=UPI0022343AE9|nr:uncharacterized protein LOC110946856 isoform X2 [Acanthochromis polyacanthus]